MIGSLLFLLFHFSPGSLLALPLGSRLHSYLLGLVTVTVTETDAPPPQPLLSPPPGLPVRCRYSVQYSTLGTYLFIRSLSATIWFSLNSTPNSTNATHYHTSLSLSLLLCRLSLPLYRPHSHNTLSSSNNRVWLEQKRACDTCPISIRAGAYSLLKSCIRSAVQCISALLRLSSDCSVELPIQEKDEAASVRRRLCP
jgi:hypothetical protein